MSVEVILPADATDPDESVNVLVAPNVYGPGVTEAVTGTGVEVIATPPRVPVKVTLPTSVPVNGAV